MSITSERAALLGRPVRQNLAVARMLTNTDRLVLHPPEAVEVAVSSTHLLHRVIKGLISNLSSGTI